MKLNRFESHRHIRNTIGTQVKKQIIDNNTDYDNYYNLFVLPFA